MNIFKFSNFNLEAEGEESISVTGQPCQFSEFQLSQIYIKRLCLKKKITHTKIIELFAGYYICILQAKRKYNSINI